MSNALVLRISSTKHLTLQSDAGIRNPLTPRPDLRHIYINVHSTSFLCIVNTLTSCLSSLIEMIDNPVLTSLVQILLPLVDI